MPLSPPHPNSRERIILYGSFGAGKTSAVLCIAALALKTSSDATFYWLDSDHGLDDMLMGERFQQLHPDNGGNLRPIYLETAENGVARMTEWEEALGKVKVDACQGDWVVVDTISQLRATGADWYVADRFDRTMAAQLDERDKQIRAKTDRKASWDLYTDVDYRIVNPKVAELEKPLTLNSPAHVVYIAREKQIDMSREQDPRVKRDFGQYGYRPDMDMNLPYRCRTTLRLTRISESWEMTTVKDREREQMVSKPFTNFAIQFLCQVAGWRM